MSLKSKIPLIGIIGIGLTTVIGSGIWKDSLIWSNEVGIFSMITISVGWVLFICAGLAYAECVSMFPKSGGPYSYVGGVFGQKAGSVVGILYLVGYLILGTLLAFLTALFTLAAINPALLNTLNLTLLTLGYLALFVILAGFSKPHIFGYISFGWVSIKIILVIIVSIFALTSWNYTAPVAFNISDYQTAINAGLWSLMGFEVMLIFSGDVDDVEKKMPKGILIVLPIILVLSLFVSFTSAGLIAVGDIPDGTGSVGLIFLLASKAGIHSSVVFGFAALSAAGTCYAILVTCFKQAKVLSEDNVLPQSLQKEKFGFTYINALIVLVSTFIIAGIMVGTNGVWESSVDVFAAVALGLVLISALFPAGLTALYLRRKMPALTRPFKTPIYFVVFPLAIILSLYLIVLNFWDIAKLWPGLVIFGVVSLAVTLLVVFVPKNTAQVKTQIE